MIKPSTIWIKALDWLKWWIHDRGDSVERLMIGRGLVRLYRQAHQSTDRTVLKHAYERLAARNQVLAAALGESPLTLRQMVHQLRDRLRGMHACDKCHPVLGPCDDCRDNVLAGFATNLARSNNEQAIGELLSKTGACRNDTDGDGDCHLCVNRGGCRASGGPY